MFSFSLNSNSTGGSPIRCLQLKKEKSVSALQLPGAEQREENCFLVVVFPVLPCGFVQ